MRKLNLTHVVPYFVPAWAYGGIPRLAYELCRQLARNGHRVNVITTDALEARSRHPEGGLTVSMEGGRMKVRYMRNISNRGAYRHQLFLPLGIKRALEELAADAEVIHIHGHRHGLETAAASFARKRNIPYIITANGTAPRIERKRGVKLILDGAVFNRVLKNASAVIAVSKAEVEQYLERGVPREKIEIIPNGVDIHAYREIPRKGMFRAEWGLDETPIVLYLGKITPRKGLLPLVRAVDILRKSRPVRLVIAGNDMGFLPRVKAEISALGMGDMITFTGLVRGMEKRALYADADVTVYPSEHEIFGLVPFESILCGTPVVVSDDSGCGEIIGGADIGEVTPYGRPEKLAAAIAGVLDNPDESRDRVERGRQFIRCNLAWPEIASRTEELYLDVLEGGKAGASAG